MKAVFLHYLKPYYWRMSVGFLIKFLGTMMDLLLPWTLAHMIDVVIPADQKREILLWGLFMLFCSVMVAVLNITANRMAARVASDAIYVIRQDLFDKIMYLTNGKVDELTRPSLISRLTSDTYHVHQMLGRVQRMGVRAPILLIGGIVMTMLLDPVLACVLLAALPMLVAVVVIVTSKSIPMFARLQDDVDRFVRLVREDIAGIRVIKALSREDYERKRFDQVNRQVVEQEQKAAMTTAITNPAVNVLLNLGLVGVVLVGAYRINEGLSEVGKILAFMSYFTTILNAMMSVSRVFINISKASASAERIVKVLDAEDERALFAEAEVRKKTVEISPPHIQFDHVGFSYNKVAYNLQDISFSLRHGETLGIIGSTGSGKSTIAQLLMRFYDVDQGGIFIDGQDIRTMNLRNLRKRFGTVFQNDALFEDSIYENINMGRGMTEEQVIEAISFAQADDFIQEKGGVGQKLDIRGANLSGGQKQRILISRALAGRPEILILDDSSSALDSRTDALLRSDLRQYFKETTCILIAQRISSIMEADHILVLEEGHAAGYGTHEELMGQCEIYQEIARSQMGI